MLTVAEHKEQTIKRAAKAGANFSRHCRNCWTGERTRAMLEAERIQYWPALIWVSTLGSRPLLDYANGADLHCFYLGRNDQHTWDEARWEKEIRALVR